ncbi:MAG: sulfotransferase, partial [Bacteroidota bacterium]
EYLPTTKFLFVLRDPVKRAESQYFNELGKGRETLSFEDALKREEEGNLTDWEKLHLQYKRRGCYVQSLEHFYAHIPKERVKIILLEELMSNWKESMTEICDFLEISVAEGVAIQVRHSNKEELLERKKMANMIPLKWVFDAWDRLSEAIIVRANKDKYSRDKWRKRTRGFYHVSRRNKREIDPKIREELYKFYLSYQEQLESLLGREIKCWKPNV